MRKKIKWGLISIILMGLMIVSGMITNKPTDQIKGHQTTGEIIYLTQLEAVEVNQIAQLGIQISSTIITDIVLQFPEEIEFMGIGEGSDENLKVSFNQEKKQLLIENNQRKVLDEENETFESDLYVKIKSQSTGSFLFKILTDNQHVFGEEVLVEVQDPSSESKSERNTRSVTNVASWAQFNSALGNGSVTEINLINSISATGSPTNLTRSVIINGNGHQLDLDNRTLTLASAQGPRTLTLKNLRLAGRANSSRISASSSNSANWTLNLEDIKFGNSIGNQNIFNLPQGKIALVGGENDLHNSARDSSTSRGMITAKLFEVTNGAKVTARVGGGFFYSSQADTVTKINQGAQLQVHSEIGLLFNQTSRSSFIVEDEGSLLKGTGNRQSTGDNGTLISMVGANSSIQLNKQGMIDIFATGTPAMLLNSANGVFSVSNDSVLKLMSSGGGNERAATLRFRSQGGQTFRAETNATIDIQKIRGGVTSSGAATAPAVRMRNDNNRFIVNSGGKVSIYNEGNGTPQNPGSVNRNQGILYTDGDNSIFELNDDNSVVKIDARFGAAIDTTNRSASITANEGTIFVARGRTAATGSGIFNTSRSQIVINKPLFFDFRNDRPEGGNIFDVSSSSSLESTRSNLSVWRKGSHLDGDPDHDWPMFDYALSGTNFNRVERSNDSNFTQIYSQGGLGATAFSRMSGNNAAPIIDELRKPTNADKSLFGHASVPVGDEGGRDAWTNEVFVKLKLTKRTGEVAELVAPTYGMNNNNPGLIIYDEKPRAGMFKQNSPQNKFLQRGDKVEVIKAWRGVSNENSNRNIVSAPEDLKVSPQFVEDVTPPSSLSVATQEVTNATKQLTGTIDLFDERDQELLPEVNLYIKVNQEFLKDEEGKLVTQKISEDSEPQGTSLKNWTINLPRYLQLNEALIEVYAKDITNLTIDPITGETAVSNPPATYTLEPEGKPGNLSVASVGYNSYPGYHDALKAERFQSAKGFNIKDILPSPPEVKKIVSSNTLDAQGNQVTQVGSLLTYTITIANSDPKDSEKIIRDTIFEDVIPAGLDFSLESSQVSLDGQMVPTERISYEESTRRLVIQLGETVPQKKYTITFQTRVESSSVGQTIENTARGEGKTPQETPFVPGPLNPNSDYLLVENSDSIINPGGEIGGRLLLESAPKLVDFGSHSVTDYAKKIAVDKEDITEPLVVEDSRKSGGNWSVTAQVVTELTNGNDVQKGALKYKYNNQLLTLNSSAQTIYEPVDKSRSQRYVITDQWGKDPSADGLKLKIESEFIPKTTGNYKGLIRWSLRETIE